MMKPLEFTRRGWRMPENTVYVGWPSKWDNPFLANEAVAFGSAFLGAVDGFRFLVTSAANWPYRKEVMAELKGKNVACWCPIDQPCPADVLLEIANGLEPIIIEVRPAPLPTGKAP